MLIDGLYRVDNLPKEPRETPKPTSTPVDASDRKFYVRAAEKGNQEALERFDAALDAQRAASQSAQAAGGNKDLTNEELAEKYAPVLVIPDGQFDRPGDPQDFIDNSRLRKDRTLRPDEERGNNINDDPNDDFSAERVGASIDDREFLDLDNDHRDQIHHTDDDPAPFFYEVTRSDDPSEPTKVTYWFFYAHNDGPGPQNHEGDWERITLEFDSATDEPARAIYSAHNNSHTKPVPYDNLQKHDETGRPLVFVASGSHASYTTPGAHPTEAPFINDQTVTDSNRDGVIDGRDGATYIDTADNLNAVADQAWYPESGRGLRWGEIGETSHTSGPYGPSEEKRHVELDDGPRGGPPPGTTTTTTSPPTGPTTTVPDRAPQPDPTAATQGPPAGTTTTIPD
jgi:hypothetical protein